MLRAQRYRCWVAVSGGSHHRNDMGAYRASVDRLMETVTRRRLGLPELTPMETGDLEQQSGPCWTLRCAGCAEPLERPDGRRHWPSEAAARAAADCQGWDCELELCPRCAALVTPLRRRIGSPAAAPVAG